MLNEHLRAVRESKGWSRDQLAQQSGLQVQVVKRLEMGVGSIANLTCAMKSVELHLSGIAKGASLTEQIRNRRNRDGITLDQLAKKAGISRATLSALEQGRGTMLPLIKVLSVLAPKARPARAVRASWNYDRNTDRDKRFTPAPFLEHIVESFGAIDLDPCGHPMSAVKARRMIILPDDGLTTSWFGTSLAFVNPPFSNLVGWLNRVVDAFEGGECEKVFLLIPTRTDSATFHDRLAPIADIAFLKGRMRFDAPEGPAYPAPFAMMAVVLGGNDQEIDRFSRLVPATWMRRDSMSGTNRTQI